MKGSRPLNNTEIRAVRGAFAGKFETRNRGLFMIGVSIGGRISELLSLRIDDVWQNDRPMTDVMFDRSVVKGGEVSRTIPVNTDGRTAIMELIDWHLECLISDEDTALDPAMPLFPSQKRTRGGQPKAINRSLAHKALQDAFEIAGLNGKLATHSMRKSFAQRLYNQTHDMYAVQEMLGHKNITTTQEYVGVDYSNVREALEAMSLAAETSAVEVMPRLDEASDAELVEELLKRQYDFTKILAPRTPNP